MQSAPFAALLADSFADSFADPFVAEPALRLAVVTETWPPEVNGVATTICKLVDGLLERGHKVQLIRPRQREREVPMLTARLTERLVRSWPLPFYDGLRMGMPCVLALLGQWRRERPDCVHIATEGPLGWSAWWAARRLGIATTSDFRTNFHHYAAHYGLPWLARPTLAVLRAFHNRCGATMVPTEAMRGELAAAGFKRLHVVGRGVDTLRFNPLRRSAALRQSWGVGEGPGQGALVLACVGRLAAEKNLELVLSAYEAVRQQHPQARLLLVGDGPLREALAARCPHAIFAGHRRDEDLAAHYASADLFLFASRTETFGNVTTEAMASGLPVLAFDHAAAGQLITSGHNGVLVRGDGDPDAAASDFVRAAVALAGDAAGRRAIGEAARATACRIGWARIVEQFEAVAARAMVETLPITVNDGDEPWTSWSRSPNSSTAMVTFDTRASAKSQ